MKSCKRDLIILYNRCYSWHNIRLQISFRIHNRIAARTGVLVQKSINTTWFALEQLLQEKP